MKKTIIRTFLLSALFVATACDSEELISEQGGEVLSRSSITEVASVDFDVDQYFDSITAPERWIQYDSFREKLDVLNLPEDILPRLSTEQLAEACAKYPLRIVYMAYDTPEKGAQVIIDNFNGFKELSKRYNYQGALINRYIKNQSSSISKEVNTLDKSTETDSERWLESRYMEVLFQTEFFTEDLDQIECSRLSTYLEREYNQTSDTSVYAKNSKARVLLKLKPSAYGLTSSTETKYRFIYTFRGREILVREYTEMEDYEINRCDNEWCLLFPKARMLDSSSSRYNCHFYAWEGVGKNKYVMFDSEGYNGKNYDNVYNYMTGDVYVRATANDSYTTVYGIDMNDKNKGTHSMNYSPSTGKYISKWGPGPLMEHSENDMPYLIPDKEYFYRMEYGARIVPQDGERAYAVGEEVILNITGIVLKSYLRYSIVLFDGKGDDACEEGKATMTYDGAYTIRATFNRPGVYELFVTGTDSNGNVRENMSYQPVIEW